jgi:hypothetical protein
VAPQPRLKQAEVAVVDQFGFEFAEAPERDRKRRSKYDDVWDAARNLCKQYPGRSLKVRTYNNSSSAYSDATAINNGEKKVFKDDFKEWEAVASESTNPEEVYPEGHKKAGQRVHAVYLKYIAPAE